MTELKKLMIEALEANIVTVDELENLTVEAIEEFEKSVAKAKKEAEKQEDFTEIARLLNKYLKTPEPVTAKEIADSIELTTSITDTIEERFKKLFEMEIPNSDVKIEVTDKDFKDPLIAFLNKHDLLS